MLDNCNLNGAGACHTFGSVTITGSTFSSNLNGDGLDVTSGGMITASNINANLNTGTCDLVAGTCTGGIGAVLDNQHASMPKTVTLSGTTNIFNNNFSDGLDVFSTGAITVKRHHCKWEWRRRRSNTERYGRQSHCWRRALLQNSFTGATSTSNVTITGSNQFKDDYYTGLSVDSSGAITANNLDAESSTLGSGAFLRNELAAYRPVTLTGVNMFNTNDLSGLVIWSNGPIVASNITANSNQKEYGAFLCNYSACNLTANPVSFQPITLTEANATYTINGNYWDGLFAESYGAITVTNVTASGNGTSTTTNGGVGAWLENDFAPAPAASPVTLNGNNTFSGNYSCLGGGAPCDPLTNSNYYGGLTVFSNGAIKANNVTANGDLAGAGADFDNSLALETAIGYFDRSQPIHE